MKVIDFYPENMDKRTQFGLMSNDSTMPMKTLDGSVIEPDAWILYEQKNSEGEDQPVLTLKAGEEIFSTISATFITKFMDIVEFMGKDDIGEITVFSRQSKKGRTYISCDLNI